MKSGWFAIFWIAACALVSAQVFALEPAPVRIRYTPAVGCPGESVFTERLLSRTFYLRPAVGGEAAVEIELELAASGDEFHGTLLFREQNGRVTLRSVSGASCDEIVSALSLIAAVLGDPATQGLSPQDSLQAPEPAVSAKPVEGSEEPRQRSAARPTRRVVPQRTLEPAPAGEDAAPASQPSRASTLRWTVGAGAALEGAIAPDPVAAAFAELGLGADIGGALSPLLLLSVNRGLTQSVPTRAGDAELTWTSARLGLCPVRWPPDGPMTLRACASFDVGVLQGSGVDTTDSGSASPPWFAAGSFARLEARFASRVAAVLDGGVVFPLRHDRYYFDPDLPETTAFEVPSAGGFARLGITVGLN